ncbi:hypothetical protein OBBRIDRAFT_788457 [Obba rivulosa]|uniref:Uncharacterized protein n=1 Tax=Obba rivulosa TaxID=1052685 RepID=A0A8E2DT91_9APHY|nr:hypothetical protein OBBRIDRAFT_788457 [Obba rivulosa]
MSDSTPTVALLGTCDTKLDELLYIREQLLERHSVKVTLIDVGRDASTHPAVNITQSAILTSSGEPIPPPLHDLPRNEVISMLIKHVSPVLKRLYDLGSIHAILAIGGSGGSSLAAGAMRSLPLGFPKLLVSTMAAGDVSPYVSDGDVTIMYSVVDIAGLNDILRPILANAAGAAAGMAHAYHERRSSSRDVTSGPEGRPRRIAITMFGVTTPAVSHARVLLESYPCTSYVFHATGAGGRALERLVSEGFFDGVLDLTTTELADLLVGGVLSAGPDRLTAAARMKVPQVVSLGALDMVNFGPRDTVPEKFKGRRLVEHNPSVTLMRTARDECLRIGEDIAKKLREADPEKTEVWVPKAGLSVLDVEGAPLRDSDADKALFQTVEDGLRDSGIKVVVHDKDINDKEFVAGMVDRLVHMMRMSRKKQ